ncbi:MAG TPA: GNAT family N-acetyltransferase [Candidatus Obscuribacterales bacterium]
MNETVNLTVRAATNADVDELVQIVQWAFRGGRPSEKQWTGEENLVKGPRVTAGSVRTMIADTRSAVLVCESQEGGCAKQLVGCIHVERENDHAHFGMLAVDPAVQSGGIGKVLMQAAEEHAIRQWKSKRMTAKVVSGRPELMDWYKRRGYTEMGETEPFLGPEHGVQPLVDGLHFKFIAKDL